MTTCTKTYLKQALNPPRALARWKEKLGATNRAGIDLYQTGQHLLLAINRVAHSSSIERASLFLENRINLLQEDPYQFGPEFNQQLKQTIRGLMIRWTMVGLLPPAILISENLVHHRPLVELFHLTLLIPSAIILGLYHLSKLEKIVTLLKQHQTEASLKVAQTNYKLLLDSIPDLLFEVDNKGKIYNFHGPEEQVYLPPEEFIGKTIEQVLPNLAATVCLQAVKLAARYGVHRGATYFLDMPTGRQFFELSITQKAGEPDRLVVLARNISKRKELEAEISHLASFPEKSPNPVLEISAAGRKPFINIAAQKIAADLFPDFPLEELEIKALQLFQPQDLPELLTRLPAGLAETINRELTLGTKTYNLVIHLLPELNTIRIYASDITEIKKAQEAAIAANQAKSLFLAAMSHEIRTPLTALASYPSFLLRTALSVEQRDYVEIVADASRQLYTTVNEVLDFSKIEAGHISLNKGPFSPKALCQQVVALFRLPAKQSKGVELIYQLDETVPGEIVGDQVKLRQILSNLINNAIKFSYDNQEVRVSLSTSNNELRFEIINSGEGIPAVKIPRLFNPYTQADLTISARYGGTGLGLAIVKKYVELMGGAIGVESQVNGKTTFWFTFPLPTQKTEVPTSSQPTIIAQLAETDFGQGKRILLAEDNPVNQRITRMILEKKGFEVVIVNNGLAAIAEATKGDFQLILMDIEMEEMDGLEATRHLRSQGIKTPIIALSGHSEDSFQEYLASGMSAATTKPFQLDEFYELLITQLKLL